MEDDEHINPCDQEFLLDNSESILPKGFTYKFLQSEIKNLFVFRIKEVDSTESAQAWLDKYLNTSNSTWRVAKTFPNSGRINIFKKKFRCHHNVCHPKVKNPKRKVKSKHTGCPAVLTVAVKRYVKRSRSKKEDYKLNYDWPCQVELLHHHNHETGSVSVFKHRSMNDKTKAELLKLFREGHSVASAVSTIKMDLHMEREARDYIYTADDKFLPTLSQAQYLFNKEFFGVCKSKSANLAVPELLPNALTTLNELVERIKTGVTEAPDVFIPALNEMVNNYNSHLKSDDALVSSMCSFGERNGTDTDRLKTHSQPTSVDRRKHPKLILGEGPLEIKRTIVNFDHDYSLPKRRRKMPILLEDAVLQILQ